MRVVIDMQGAQSAASGFRGVGRYIRELTKELILCSKGELDIYLALNGRLECNHLFKYFDGVIDRDHIKVWNYYPEVPPACLTNNDEPKPEELFHEWFMHQFNADIIWVPNFQEGYGDANVAATVKLTRGRETIISTLHDVTPLIYAEDYLNPNIKPWYMRKLQYVCDSDIVLTDSEFSKDKISELLGISRNKIEVVLLSYDSKVFYSSDKYLSANSKGKYFLYAGGSDQHKNLKRLIEAFGMLGDNITSEYKILFAGKEPLADKNKLLKYAEEAGIDKKCLVFLGYVSDDDLRLYMQKCTAFVFPSYAEGFGLPPLEAMACGAPTLVANATSVREIVLDKDAQFDPWSVKDISKKMKRVITDKKYADRLIKSGIARAKDFSWAKGAKQIKDIMLNAPIQKKGMSYSKHDLCLDLKKILVPNNYKYKAAVAKSIEHGTLFNRIKHIYIDTSAVVLEDYVSGIQRVVNGFIVSIEKMFKDRDDVEVRAIYSDPSVNTFYYSFYNGKKYVKQKSLSMNCVVDFYDGDILIMPDLHPSNIIAKENYLISLSKRGVKVFTSLNDIIPMQYPEFFDQGFVEEYKKYLKAISHFSGIISISKATMNSYNDWCKENDVTRPPFFVNDYNYLGADINHANPSKGLPDNSEEIIDNIKKNPTVLMVGTIEPRKKQDLVLDALDVLWSRNKDINLVFVGRNGWQMDNFVKRIKEHEQNGKKLFWLSGISDEFLDMVYAFSSGVIVASLEEGYGLPIIEAAQHGKPLLLRDIPVFKEIAGKFAKYFSGDKAEKLADSIFDWINDIAKGSAPDSSKIKYYSWEESGRGLIEKIDSSLLADRNHYINNNSYSGYNSIDYFDFEESFRGNTEEIKYRQQQYLKYFKNCSNVLDIGCGRGEFLELLRENGINSEGVDVYEKFVVEGQRRGLKITCGDGISFLQSKLEWDGIFCAQVIEHITFDQIIKLCSEAYYRLKKGSYLLIETPNPTKLDMFTHTFYLDPTHNKPIHPATLKYLLEKIGFSEVEIVFTEESKSDYTIPMFEGDGLTNLEEINHAIFVLNDYLFGSADYAIIAQK